MTTSPAPKPTGLLLDPLFQKHDPGPGHPESVHRYEAIIQRLTAAKIPGCTQKIPLRAVTEDELLLCHHPAYVELARKEITAGRRDLSTGDTSVCKDSLAVAENAAGSVLNAVDAVVQGDLANAFCAVRPPGHHATHSRGMGFCIFNNIAIAARYAQREHGIGNVAIVDWDVHHGNGTHDIFYEDPTVFFFSTHQSPLYPGTGAASETGAGKGKGTTINCPFPAHTGMKEIGAAFRDQLLPALDTFKPELILVSAGFDSRIDDPLGAFTLTDDDFAALTKLLREIADRHAEGRIVSMLEGGYNVRGLASAVQSHIEALMPPPR